MDKPYLMNKDPKSLTFVFDSAEDALNLCYRSHMKRNYDPGFTGREVTTLQDAKRLMNESWAEGQEVLAKYVKDLSDNELPELKSHKRQVNFQEDDGDEVDYDRLRSGQPFWRTVDREVVTGPTEVTIFLDVGATMMQSSENLLWRGAAGIALAKLLEERGYAVEIWAINKTTRTFEVFSDTFPTVIATRLKQCSDPLDVSTLINTVSGWCYRTIFFALKVALGELEHLRCDELSMGGTIVPTQDDCDKVSIDELRILSAGVFNYRDALAMVAAELKRLQEQE